MDLIAAVPVLIAAVISITATAGLANRRWPVLQVLDQPNARSLHARPVPRSGGLAVLTGWLVALLLISVLVGLRPELAWLALAVMLVAAVSYWDDRHDLSTRTRLLVHLLAAGLLWLGGLRWDLLGLPGPLVPLPQWLALALTLLYLTWMINLYNFMDGMDGLAGTMSAVGFGALAWLGLAGGDLLYATTCAAVAAAAAGFLTGNLPPARIFLGDVGSSSLGLLAGGLTLWGASAELFPLWVGWLVFSPFIVDATWTLLRRAFRRERFWEAHRSHHYQRLVLAGWGHRRTLGWAAVLITAVAASALAAVDMTTAEQWQLIGAWGLVYLLIHLRVGLAERLQRG
ncbi:MraY family glycosyltransferase [Halochromatium glycolicum]|uniref:Glycosyl transferase n=1 Tax=Halochromatium glycolicum TaxID=85075 RepID=A0AAJ0U5D5_9GAMM|nr:glycosyltransferase family 4 protein [Halochromatium glycolicum]MBK1705585.1 glycosyl transferase [Halochromatium glycolicum]